MQHIWIPKVLSRLDVLKAMVAPGRPRKLVPGSYLADLVALRKVILLCSGCLRNFDGRPYGYCKEEILCWAKCDVCRTPTQNAQAFFPEENWYVAHAGNPPPTKGRRALSRMSQRKTSEIPKPKTWLENMAYVLDFKR